MTVGAALTLSLLLLVFYPFCHWWKQDRNELRAEVEKIIGRGSGYDDTDLHMTPRAGRTIKRAISTAREQGFMFVEPEHLLLAILDGDEGVALRILENLGASLPQLRKATQVQLQTLPQQPVPQQTRESEVVNSLLPAIPSVDRTAND